MVAMSPFRVVDVRYCSHCVINVISVIFLELEYYREIKVKEPTGVRREAVQQMGENI